MEKSTKHYWAVVEGKSVKFSGTHSQCWTHLVHTYGAYTVSGLLSENIRIIRITRIN